MVVAALAVAGCATTASLRLAERAELAQDYDRAIVEYTRALQADPDNRAARQGLDRSTLRGAEDHFLRGRRHHAAGRLDEALVELQLAAELNPGDGNIEDLLTGVRTQLRTKVAIAREGKTQLESLIERSQGFQPAGLMRAAATSTRPWPDSPT